MSSCPCPRCRQRSGAEPEREDAKMVQRAALRASRSKVARAAVVTASRAKHRSPSPRSASGPAVEPTNP
jgi:hypothetical protein